MLARVVRRLSRAELIDEIVVATTNGAADEVIVQECNRLSVAYFQGSEEDVLDRHYRAAMEHGAEAVVRIPSDKPAIDPEVCDFVVRTFPGEAAGLCQQCLATYIPSGPGHGDYDLCRAGESLEGGNQAIRTNSCNTLYL